MTGATILRSTSLVLAVLLAGSAEAEEKKKAPQPAPKTEPTRPAAAGTVRRGRLLVAPKLGLFEPVPSRLSGAFYVGLELGYVTPLLGNALAVALELDWHQPKATGTISDPRLTVNGTTADGAYRLWETEIGLLLSLVYRSEDTFFAGCTPYGGLGPGIYWHRASISAFGSTNLETEATVGLQLFGGADFRLGPGAVFAEARYHFSRVHFRSTGDANVGGLLALGLGYRLRFF
jgi:hypothetical protein